MEENAVARKMILTGGPGSRRFDPRLCAGFEILTWCSAWVGRGLCLAWHSSYCGILFLG